MSDDNITTIILNMDKNKLNDTQIKGINKLSNIVTILKKTVKKIKEKGMNCDGPVINNYWGMFYNFWDNLTKINFSNSKSFKAYFLIHLINLGEYELRSGDKMENITDTLFEEFTEKDIDKTIIHILNYKQNTQPSTCTLVQKSIIELSQYDKEINAYVKDNKIGKMDDLFDSLLKLQLKALMKKTEKVSPELNNFIDIISKKINAVNSILIYPKQEIKVQSGGQSTQNDIYHHKYLKYKSKYIHLKQNQKRYV